jgi:predicted RNA-binding Zn ribbon-like protein
MADTYYDNSKRKTGGKLVSLLLGLLIGLLLGGGLTYAIKSATDTTTDSKQSTSNSTSSKSSDNSEASKVVATDETATTQARLAEYSHLIVEASRENVDTPSDEGTAAKTALQNATDKLSKALGDKGPIKSDLNAVNSSLFAYAATARTSDEHGAVDQAFTKLVTDLQGNYTVKNPSALQSHTTSVKNAILESVRDFVKKDYDGSYAKQVEAEQEFNQMFAQLQNK